METEKQVKKQEDIMKLLEAIYEKAVNGIPTISKPIDKLAEEYLSKTDSVEKAAKKFNRYQIAKCTTSGFLTSMGGILTLPVMIPANISSVLYVQMRMIACLAYMGGYDLDSDQVQTLVYACLAGVAVDVVLKKAGIEIGEKFGMAMVKKIPGKVVQAINKKAGFRLVTKAGEKGVVNLSKLVPVLGAVIGGGFDLVETRAIAGRAYKMFIKGNFSGERVTEEEPMDAEVYEAEFEEFADET